MTMPSEELAFCATSDLAGLVRGKGFPIAELESRLRRGVGITHSNILMSAFGPIYDTPFGTAGDLMLVPDPAARAPIPLADGREEGGEATLFLGSFLTTDGQPWECCPRGFLARALDALRREAGLVLHATFEQEFTFTGIEDRPGASYSLDALRRQGAFGGVLMAALRRAGVTPDSFLPESGPRQFEVTTAPAAGLRAADEAVIAREVTRAVAARLGHRAILSPILRPDGIGNGTHVHFSLWDADGAPATYDPAGRHGLSAAAEHFAAGVLHHMPALTAVTAPSVASYFRLRPGRWAPTVADLGVQDRGSGLRICPFYATAADSVAKQFNLEYRVADAAASPYLALGALVQAGVDGLREGRRLGDVSPVPLPGSLTEAVGRLAVSLAARDWFGPLFHDVYLRFKRSEIAVLAGLADAEICDRYAAVY